MTSASTTSPARPNLLNAMQAEACPPHSDLYWALKGTPDQERSPLIAWYAFVQTIRKLSEQYTHPEVIPVKLGWWHNEVQHLFEGRPTHPVTQALEPYIEPYQLTTTPFEALIEAAQLSLETHLFPNQAALNHHYQHTGGIALSMHAKLLHANCDEPTLHELGIALELVRHMIDWPHHLKRGHLYLPEDQLTHSAEALLRSKNEQDFTAYLQDQAILARTLSEKSLNTLKNSPKSITRLAKLSLLRLKLIEKAGFPVLSCQIEPGLLRTLWSLR